MTQHEEQTPMMTPEPRVGSSTEVSGDSDRQQPKQPEHASPGPMKGDEPQTVPENDAEETPPKEHQYRRLWRLGKTIWKLIVLVLLFVLVVLASRAGYKLERITQADVGMVGTGPISDAHITPVGARTSTRSSLRSPPGNLETTAQPADLKSRTDKAATNGGLIKLYLDASQLPLCDAANGRDDTPCREASGQRVRMQMTQSSHLLAPVRCVPAALRSHATDDCELAKSVYRLINDSRIEILEKGRYDATVQVTARCLNGSGLSISLSLDVNESLEVKKKAGVCQTDRDLVVSVTVTLNLKPQDQLTVTLEMGQMPPADSRMALQISAMHSTTFVQLVKR